MLISFIDIDFVIDFISVLISLLISIDFVN